jgi:ELWxxDGT repeat protein
VNAATGRELRKSNGSAAGTVLVKDITPGTAGTDHGGLTNVRGMLFFVVNAGTQGKQLWKSDGTPTGTLLVKNIGLGKLGP